jgi:excinuclease ABC subunit A
MASIRIRGARTHNLRNLDIDLPRDRLIVITGLSGSGKSSLAFDTLYAEGQRRYVESLSSYARQFLSVMDKPDVDSIEGLSPAIAIEQKAASHNPRSTVGTVTEINDYLRLLYARIGMPRCPDHGIDLAAQTVSQMVDQALALPEGASALLLAPVIEGRKGEHQEVLDSLRAQGYVRARIDGRVHEFDALPALDPRKKHSIAVVVDRFRVRPDAAQRLAESFETALRLANGTAVVAPAADAAFEEQLFSNQHACPSCGYSLPLLEPKMFLSLADGAIRGWDRHNSHYFHLLVSLAKHYKFDLEKPWEKLPDKARQVLLHGSGEEIIEFRYPEAGGRAARRNHRFEGVLPNLERRYAESQSPTVREELAKFLGRRPCSDCGGARLNKAARHVFVGDRALHDISHLAVGDAQAFVAQLAPPGWRGEVASRILREVANRLRFLADVGLDYLTLDRSAETLSGGEAQRIRLASQIGSGLTGVMYILDEPSIGLHQRDNQRLLGTLHALRDLGNTVIMVEHDTEAIQSADQVLDLGPGAGVHGGALVAQGTPAEIAAHPHSITGQYLSGRKSIPLPLLRTRRNPQRELGIRGARANNLHDVDAAIPLGLLTCVTGVSGSGKSTLIVDTLLCTVEAKLNGNPVDHGLATEITGLQYIDRVIDIDQSPIGRTPRSNPATYTGIFGPLRELFAATSEARARGYDPGRFSFNVKGGRCEACQGDGVIRVELHFLPDVYVPCDVCKGKRYNRETLEIRWRGLSIQDALELTVEDALRLFAAVPALQSRLQTLMDVGLSYMRLGQNATTLSGGEAQRIKLARELAKRATGRTLYVLDEPTTGLHFHDVAQLLTVLHRLRDEGNTVLIIEHNLDVIKTADWIIEMGPEGGARGGRLVFAGTPEELAQHSSAYTAPYLAPLLATRKR